jgi:quercetin dioxygenase-like cupin family protein
MFKKPAQFGAIVSVLFIVACSKSEPEAVSEPQPAAEPPTAADSMPDPATEPAGGSDPTVIDPDHYKVEFENEAVRILRINYGPGEESVMHAHPDSVAVFLTDIKAQMTMADGSSEEVQVAAGDASFSAGGEHQVKNISDSAWEVVEVELKPRDSSAQGESAGPDATVVDADHYATEFENESVRIVRIKYGAGEESIMHYHPDSVAVFVTDHLVQMTMPDGSKEDIPASAGDALFIPGGQHLPKNISDSAWELVLIELKD